DAGEGLEGDNRVLDDANASDAVGKPSGEDSAEAHAEQSVRTERSSGDGRKVHFFRDTRKREGEHLEIHAVDHEGNEDGRGDEDCDAVGWVWAGASHLYESKRKYPVRAAPPVVDTSEPSPASSASSNATEEN